MATEGSQPQTAVQWVYSNSKHTGNVYHVLLTLAIAYGEKGACLSMKDIADRTKVSEATARRAVETLTADDTIKVIRNGGEQRKHGTTNCYRIVGYDTSITIVTPPANDTPVTQEIPHDDEPLSPGDTPVTPENLKGVASGDTPSEPVEYVHAAGDKDCLLSLKQKDSLVLSETEKDKTDSLSPDDLNKGVPDDFEDEPVTEVDIAPLDTRDDGYGKAALAFLQKISPLTSLLSNDLADTVKDYGSYPTVLAIYDAANEVAKAQRGERTPIKCSTWSYAKGILKKQKAEGDLPVEVAFKSDTTTDDFDPFNHDDDLPEPEIEPEPVNAQWRELNDFIQSQNRELYRMHLSQCRFGTFESGRLTVLVPTERVQTACIWELNHRGAFTQWCKDFWQGLETVEFVLEGELHAHPETG